MQKKTSFPEVKRNWHIPKSVEKVEKKEIFLKGEKPCRFITSWAWKAAFQLRTAWFQWGFLCCLCFGCRCAVSWDIMGYEGIVGRIGKWCEPHLYEIFIIFSYSYSPQPASSVAQCIESLGENKGKNLSCSSLP